MAQQKYRPQRSKQAGIGLMELSLALVIIAVFIVMAMRYYQTTKRNVLVNQAITDINSIIASTNEWALGEPIDGFANLSFQNLKDNGLLPDHMADSYPNVMSAFNTPLTLTPLNETQYQLSFLTHETQLGACNAITARLATSTHIKAGPCTGGVVTVTYDRLTTLP